MSPKAKIGAVIVAAGSGLRFGEQKQFKNLGAKPLYQYSLKRFTECQLIDEITLVVPTELSSNVFDEVAELSPNITVASGGKLRQDSVLAGVEALSKDCKVVIVHDAARPFVSDKLIESTINACKNNDGAIAAIPAYDTVKLVNADRLISKTLPRENIWLAQTPQAFNRVKLLDALQNTKNNNIEVTDESSLMETLNYSIVIIEGDVQNIKITSPEDWRFAELILEKYND